MNKIISTSINWIKDLKKLPKQSKIKILGGICIAIIAVITLCAATSDYTGPDFYKYKNLQDKELYCLGYISRITQARRWAMTENEYTELISNIDATFDWYSIYYGIEIVQNPDGTVNLLKTLNDREQEILIASDSYADYIYKKLDKNGECQKYSDQLKAIEENSRKKYGEMYFVLPAAQQELQDFKYKNKEKDEKCQFKIQKMVQEQKNLEGECVRVYLDLRKKLENYIIEQQEEQEIKSKYPEKKNCFAYWMPHGAMWQEQCYDSKKDCEKARKERASMGSKINRSECYNVNYLGAYCINDILAGYTKYSDMDNTEYEVTTEVCTKDIDECESFKQYQAKGSRSQCVRKIVPDAEWEGSFLTSKEKLNDIIKNNQKNSESNICTKYLPASNQQQAFEKLGLDWNRTKKWGAFVDTNNVLRANKPSCREIVKGSAEYKKYEK